MPQQNSVPRVLIVGAGIAGMQAALDVANAGYEVVLVERLPSIGGRMAQLSETFPTLDCSQCILTPRTVEVGNHDKIDLITYADIASISGEAGHFQVRIRRYPSYVDWEKCTGCGLCQEKCPGKATSEFQRGTGKRKAIYTLSPQAVPNKPVIDPEACIYFQRGKCRACERLCPTEAIDYEQEETFIDVEVGAIILATGYQLYEMKNLPEYGGGKVPDVIDALAFERILSASGPTAGEVKRPSDGATPHEIVFIQCAGSRAPERHNAHCSKICCMYTAKQSILYRHRVHDGQAYVFYIDIRAGGKRYDEFTQRAMEEERTVYLRGKVSRIFRDGEKVMVWGADTLSGKQVQIAADMVVLAPAILPRPETRRLADMLGIDIDDVGWLRPSNENIYPVETGREGIFVAGTTVGPMDIPETVAHASGAAAKVLKRFSRGNS